MAIYDPGKEWAELAHSLIDKHGTMYVIGFLIGVLTRLTKNDHDLRRELTARIDATKKKHIDT
jgi:hypothetical protein|tara:strand:+ start:2315 stop:2503 length:189 start_codon:yes stop_codon:yes gene_type:complete